MNTATPKEPIAKSAKVTISFSDAGQCFARISVTDKDGNVLDQASNEPPLPYKGAAMVVAAWATAMALEGTKLKASVVIEHNEESALRLNIGKLGGVLSDTELGANLARQGLSVPEVIEMAVLAMIEQHIARRQYTELCQKSKARLGWCATNNTAHLVVSVTRMLAGIAGDMPKIDTACRAEVAEFASVLEPFRLKLLPGLSFKGNRDAGVAFLGAYGHYK